MANQAEIAEIDAFLASPKLLYGGVPVWDGSKFFRRGDEEQAASWPLTDDIGIVGKGRFQFVFRPMRDDSISISLLYGGRSVARLDFDDESRCEFNPVWAEGMGLPNRVCGNHVHRWEDNRAHIALQESWALQARVPLPPQVRKLEQAVCWLADYANVKLMPEQRGFEPPASL